jgi:hypothetical protein
MGRAVAAVGFAGVVHDGSSAWRRGSIVLRHEETVGGRTRFFFEKKNQKTFIR